jgi:hypothetical protein
MLQFVVESFDFRGRHQLEGVYLGLELLKLEGLGFFSMCP